MKQMTDNVDQAVEYVISDILLSTFTATELITHDNYQDQAPYQLIQ